MSSSGYSFATICSSNVNRSMAGHLKLKENHIRVSSFGTGREIKIPGLRKDEPLCFPFGTEYSHIRKTMSEKNREFYESQKLISIMRRNENIKPAPQRFQDADLSQIDICICFDENVFDLVIEDLQFRTCQGVKPLLVFNMHVKDRPDEAVEGAEKALILAEMLNKCTDLERDACTVKKSFENKTNIPLLFALFYL